MIKAKQHLLDLCSTEQSPAPSSLVALVQTIRERIASDFSLEGALGQFIDYSTIKRLNAAGERSHMFVDQIDPTVSLREKYFFYTQLEMRQKNIATVLTPLLQPTDAILEIGAGLLDTKGESFISSALTQPLATRFEYCEVNPSLVQTSLELCPTAKIRHLDSATWGAAYSPRSFDWIVANNVLDTLSQEDLEEAVQSIAFLLRPGGKFIHFSNLGPFIYAFCHYVLQETSFALLIKQDPYNYYLCLVDKQFYQKELRKQVAASESTEILAFLDYLCTLSASQQERLCNGLFHLFTPAEFFSFVDHFSPSCQLYYPFPAFQSLLEKKLSLHFSSVNTEVIRTEKIKKIVPSDPFHQMQITCGPSGVAYEENDQLSWGTFQLGIETSVTMAAEVHAGRKKGRIA